MSKPLYKLFALIIVIGTIYGVAVSNAPSFGTTIGREFRPVITQPIPQPRQKPTFTPLARQHEAPVPAEPTLQLTQPTTRVGPAAERPAVAYPEKAPASSDK